ncbi:unnamed protein product [Heligmosomoides polygyrus]|uniref:Reverse transcriptase domain-containing protein n=1 Tax=Heligmosomoides polygyrus TaxID=6339 RepID=A0A183GJN1_HELPZ|nr:unnamed protein product [Heligmosomoides polygyrus]
MRPSRWPTGWTPVPVHTLKLEEDHAGNIFAPCPRAEQLDNELRNSNEFLSIAKENEGFLQFLSNKTGMIVDLPNIYLINDAHYIETVYNMSQPGWMTANVSEHLRELTELVNEYTNQCGFVAGCGTIDAIHADRLLIEKHREKQKPVHIAFLDLEKAFDRVPREEMWYALRYHGVPEGLIE